MTYVYLAHAPEDKIFAAKLSADLQKAGITNWFDDGAADEVAYKNLKQATHVVTVLSPAATLAERVLAALEHAKQEKLIRVALRLTTMENLPPQLQGIIPLDFSDEAEYPENLLTLLSDLKLDTSPLKVKLPTDILEALHNPDAEERKKAVEKLSAYRTSEKDYKVLAREELSALAFREKDTNVKQLVHLTLKIFDTGPLAPEVVIPSKEELAEQAAAELILPTTAPLPAPPEPVLPKTRRVYLWNAPRWYVVLGVIGILLAVAMAAIAGNPVYGLPVLLVGLLLPYFNVAIRASGQYQWQMPGSLIGNSILGLLLGGITAAILMVAVADLEGGILALGVGLGLLLGGFIGWLATLNFEVAA